MTHQQIIPSEVIVQKIYFLRNQKVMLDKDLADLFGVKSIWLREQVKRNQEKFLSHFMFQLNDQEVEIMVSHFAIPSRRHLGRSLPYAFTEFGILMLANVLKSDKATQMSIFIIEIFVRLRELLHFNKDLLQKLEQIEKQVIESKEDIDMIIVTLKKTYRTADCIKKADRF